MWLLSFVLAFGLGAVWAIATPVLAHPDEPAHSVKAAAVVRGELVPPKLALPDEGSDSLLRGAFTTLVDVPAAYSFQTSTIPECYIWDPSASAACAPGWEADDSPAEWTAFIGRYPPGYYAAVGWPSLLTTAVSGFYAMRLLSAALSAALVATAMALGAAAPRYRFVPLAVVAAATPQMFVLAGSVNPNSLEAAAGLCVWALVAAALTWEGTRLPVPLVVAIVVASTALAITRPLSSMWLAAIALCSAVAFGDRSRIARRFRQPSVRAGAAVVFVAALAGAVWTVLSDALDNNRGYNPWGLGLVDAARHSLALTGSYMEQTVAAFGWLRTTGPAWITIGWGIGAAALLLWAVRHSDGRRRLALLLVVAVWLATPTLLQAPTAKEFGFVWSGRYGLALAAGVPVVAAVAAGARTVRPPWLPLGAGAGLAVFLHLAAHVVGVRRFAVGTDGPINYLGAPGAWDPPLPAVVLLAATGLLAAGLAAVAVAIARAGVDAGGGHPE